MIDTAWTDYSLEVLPLNATEVQRMETRRVFYAGAYAVMCAMVGIGDDSVSESDGINLMESMLQECEQFKSDVIAGKA